ncbi:WG repeat-containing protein [Candidatus Saccharibacteria bacterium]|nr:WG repeat-containing protein [Candidatus Saccharibacteria bacterium]
MDNNSFTPSGQGSPNNMTPQSTPEPAPEPTPNPTPTPTPEPTPTPTPEPTPNPKSTPAPTVAPEPTSEPPITPASPLESNSMPTTEPTPKTPKKTNTKLLIIICACIGVLALIAVILFIIPFSSNGTLWDSITNNKSSSSGSSSPTSNERKTGNTVVSGDYTYTANLDLEYEPKGAFHDGLMKVITADGDIAYLDTTGNIAFTLDLSYEPYGNFSNGLLAVRCNANRTKVKPSIRSGGYAMRNERTLGNEIETRTYGFLDKTGNLAIPCDYAEVKEFQNGYAAVIATQDRNLRNSYSIIDPAGQTVVPSGKYSNIVMEDNTFKDGIFKSAYAINPDANEYGWGCFNLSGEQLDTFSNYEGTCAEDADKDTIRESVQAKLGSSDTVHVSDPSEGLLLVSQMDPYSAYVVDTNGDTVWTIDIDKVVDADDDQYTEGLLPIAMWVGDGERPSLETMMSTGLTDEQLYQNAGIVYYDHSGEPVFIYRYSRLLENNE